MKNEKLKILPRNSTLCNYSIDERDRKLGNNSSSPLLLHNLNLKSLNLKNLNLKNLNLKNLKKVGSGSGIRKQTEYVEVGPADAQEEQTTPDESTSSG